MRVAGVTGIGTGVGRVCGQGLIIRAIGLGSIDPSRLVITALEPVAIAGGNPFVVR